MDRFGDASFSLGLDRKERKKYRRRAFPTIDDEFFVLVETRRSIPRLAIVVTSRDNSRVSVSHRLIFNLLERLLDITRAVIVPLTAAYSTIRSRTFTFDDNAGAQRRP